MSSRSRKPVSVPADDTQTRIAAAIARVPRGRVSTYGALAAVAGLPGRARLVGTVLKNQPDSSRLPWFRVINAAGHSSFPEGSEPYRQQRARLAAEGVPFVRGRVDLKRFGWPETHNLDESLWGQVATSSKMARIMRRRR